MGKKKEDEILEFLREIAEGRVLLTPKADPGRVYAGNVFYEASNGCQVVLFNDCNAWDYVDSVIVDGRRYDAEFSWERITVSDQDAWRIWRIPGYLTFRCHGCGEIIESTGDPDNAEDYEWSRCAKCPPESVHKGMHAPMPKKWELSQAARTLLEKHR
jgi:hypothetical protein